MSQDCLRFGVAGLGRAFQGMLPAFLGDPRVRLVAAADPYEPARQAFERDFEAATHPTVEALCADPLVQVVYVATPHEFHEAHVLLAAAAGKHVLVEKPMALTLASCARMVEACRRAGVKLVVGPTHGFDSPILLARQLLDSGDFGSVRLIHMFNFTDFMVRPRRPEELDANLGGGVVHNQAAHQVDVARLLGGGKVVRCRAQTGRVDPRRPVVGAYSALLEFAQGAIASLTYSGYGRFDTDTLMGGIGESGTVKTSPYGEARRRLHAAHSPAEEARLRRQRGYGGSPLDRAGLSAPSPAYAHFGHVVISCDEADLVPTPTGVTVFADAVEERRLPLPAMRKGEVIDELWSSVIEGRAVRHSGEWGMATTEVCLAMLESSQTGHDIEMRHQVAYQATAPATAWVP